MALPAMAEVELPELDQNQSIAISAEAANHWRQGAFEVWLLRGNCRIAQATGGARCDEAVLWIDSSEAGQTPGLLFDPARETAPPGRRGKVIAYLEGNVTIEVQRRSGPARLNDRSWLGRFYTNRSVDVQAARVAGRPDVLPGVYQRAVQRRSPDSPDILRRTEVAQAQFTAPTPQPVVGQPLPPGTRRVRVFPRGDTPVQAQVRPPEPGTNQWIIIVDQGVNLIVDGTPNTGSIDVSSDRMVIWTSSRQEPDLNGQVPQDERTPMEVYLEGNIVFREGDRVIRADRMYYDVPNHLGTVLEADVLTPAPSYVGLIRLHAQVLQQTDRTHFFAQNAFVTSSRLGVPRYRIQAGQMSYEDIPHPAVDLAGRAMLDPGGQPIIQHERLVTSQNNLLFLEDVPVFYWPTLAADLNESSFYLRRIRFKNDNVMGTQILTDWNVYQLLGIRRPPPGTDWDLSLDYLSKRGFGHGTTYQYHVNNLFDIPGPTAGMVDYWGIKDDGFDVLGRGREHVIPEESYRYRFIWQHRQQLPAGFQITAEVGKISDRNFLEEFYKREWDELKDQSTDVELKRIRENTSWSIMAGARLDNFFTETQWLPRADHFWLGQNLFNALTWHEHTSLAYGQFRTGTLPDAALGDQAVSHLPWEPVNRQGERIVTRQELDWPIQLGVFKFVPYALGELGHWGEDLNGDSFNRAYYRAGIRASLPMWAVDPTIESTLWNVHGLAHKVVFQVDAYHAEANRRMTDLPLYDPLDDNSIEAFRRRFVVNTFGFPAVPPPGTQGPPLPFDERTYALRTGMGGWVTAPSMEIADTQTAVDLGVHQRWQTKRGPPDNRHIIDWITLDTDVTLFPNPDRDNFGQVAGLLDYQFNWHIGDRLTLVSDGIFDFFDQGQRIVTVGGFLNRPPRGALYAGVRLLDGPIHSTILSSSYSYWMSPKWVSSLGVMVDLNNTQNFNENLRITRIGESMLISAGFTHDASRNSVGVNFAIEPRFLPKGQLGRIGGANIPPAGAFGLE